MFVRRVKANKADVKMRSTLEKSNLNELRIFQLFIMQHAVATVQALNHGIAIMKTV